jgi:hypothetical protein
VFVITLSGERVSAITRFDSTLLGALGLPEHGLDAPA